MIGNPGVLRSSGPKRMLIGPPSRRRILSSVLKAADLVSMVVAFGVATLVMPLQPETPSLEELFAIRLKAENFALFAALLVVWYGTFSLFGLYDPNRPQLVRRGRTEAINATTLGAVVIGLCAIPLRIDILTPVFLLVFWAASSALVVASRMLIRALLSLAGWTDLLQRNLLILGSGPLALRYASEVEEDPECGRRIVGFADEEWPGLASFQKGGRSLVSDLKNLAFYLRDNVVDEVVIALPVTVLHECGEQPMAACEEHGVTVRFLASVLTDLDLGVLKRERLDDTLVTVYNGSVDGWPLITKRVFDVCASAWLLLTLAPLFALIFGVVRLTSPGPAFFSQQRVGLNKRHFGMYKFRTMIDGAEDHLADLAHRNEIDGPAFKIKDDPRITPVGRFLRRTSLDELPQLLNVLKGDMSLVGPRPLPLRDVEGFIGDRHRRRFSVRPGLTGLWQVSGRSAIPFEQWMELDLLYVDQWSLGLDLWILARTPPAVLRGDGAS